MNCNILCANWLLGLCIDPTKFATGLPFITIYGNLVLSAHVMHFFDLLLAGRWRIRSPLELGSSFVTLDGTRSTFWLLPTTSTKARYFQLYVGLYQIDCVRLPVYARRTADSFATTVFCNGGNVFEVTSSNGMSK